MAHSTSLQNKMLASMHRSSASISTRRATRAVRFFRVLTTFDFFCTCAEGSPEGGQGLVSRRYSQSPRALSEVVVRAKPGGGDTPEQRLQHGSMERACSSF